MPATSDTTRIKRTRIGMRLDRHERSPTIHRAATRASGMRDDAPPTMSVRERPATAVAERLSPWAPLRHHVFAALFAAQLGSNIGTFFQTVAAAWLMGDLTTSPTLVALIQTASLLPLLLLGLPAGALADIFDRRLLLLATQAWMVVCAGIAGGADVDRPRHAGRPPRR